MLGVLLTMLLAASPASAASPADVCAAFPHTQTYISDLGFLRAPAWHYDKPVVTIVYDADSCDAQMSGAEEYTLSIAGSATVYKGLTAAGAAIDERPFTSVIQSDSEDGELGWPIEWWSCFDGSFSYVWTIDGVYVFSISAEDGRWVMVQRDAASDEALAYQADACKTE
jgi:hypothetical protein